MKIGFFDSGQGGVEILNAVHKHLPQYDYLYFGDTKHVPYGDRTEAEVYELTKAGVEWLFEAGSVLVILACNTASAETARRLQQEFLPARYPDRKLLGVIIPTVETIIESGASSVTLLATKRTVDSHKYEIELEKLHGTTELKAIAMPELVPLIESGNLSEATVRLESVLDTLAVGEVVVMGCTHYSILDSHLKPATKEKYKIIYQTEIIPEKLEKYLEKHAELREQLTGGGTVTHHFTGDTSPMP